MKIKEYALVYAGSEEQLISWVNENIEAGWQPFGNIAILNTNRNYTIYQTMVKYE